MPNPSRIEVTLGTLQCAFLFVVMGLLSAIVSGLAVASKTFPFVVPGVAFGVALCIATLATGYGFRRPWLIGIVSVVAFVAAEAACFLMLALDDGGLLVTGLGGAICGLIGGAILAASLITEASSHRAGYFFVISTMGCLLGALSMPLSIWISDNPGLGHPWDDFVLFAVWQTGVMLVIALCRQRTPWRYDPAANLS
jgi:hypothetical protein